MVINRAVETQTGSAATPGNKVFLLKKLAHAKIVMTAAQPAAEEPLCFSNDFLGGRATRAPNKSSQILPGSIKKLVRVK